MFYYVWLLYHKIDKFKELNIKFEIPKFSTKTIEMKREIVN